jgi:hypothetical protein
MLDDWMFESRQSLGIFPFTAAFRPTLGPTHLPIQWVPGALSVGVKGPGREPDHSPPSSAEVKECVTLYPHSPNTPPWLGACWSPRPELHDGVILLQSSINQWSASPPLAGVMTALLQVLQIKVSVPFFLVDCFLYIVPRILGERKGARLCVPKRATCSWTWRHIPLAQGWNRTQAKRMDNFEI